jgi:hypothetical protein
MHHYLREAAKVAVGLFIADIASVLWLGAAGFFPLTILGVTWTATAALTTALFDVAVIILLVHFGWNTRVPLRSPSEKTLLMISGVVFLVVALAHLLRLALGIDIALGDFMVPVWLSWFGVVVTAYLSYSSFHFAMRRGR